ncbi:MAG: hypothetical protein H0V93_16365 [Euzebyales bacterium]|nr:hypothetical protein [Euzebyales bacterium]
MAGTVLHVRDGQIVGDGSWVYAWLLPGTPRPVVYVGATGLDPALRTWLHLNHDDPEVGRVAARYPSSGGQLDTPFDVLAFDVPVGALRSEVKTCLISRLSAENLLAPTYIGDPPVNHVETTAEQFVIDVVRAISRATDSRAT